MLRMMLTWIRKYWFLGLGLFFPFANLFAEETAHGGGSASSAGWSIGVGMAVAVAGAATAQGKIAASFMDGVSRNPGAQKSMFVPLILGLAFVETLVLFTFLVMQSLLGKV